MVRKKTMQYTSSDGILATRNLRHAMNMRSELRLCEMLVSLFGWRGFLATLLACCDEPVDFYQARIISIVN
jgi:hypothetical protein